MHAGRAETPELLTEAEVLDRLRARGGEVPEPRQVRRWRVLLEPVRAPSGGKPGRPPLRYRPEAVDRLEAIMAIRAGHQKPLDVLGFELWWGGFAEAKARAHIASILNGDGAIHFSPGDDPADLADRMYIELHDKRPRTGLFALLADRVGGDREALLTGMYALLMLLLGGSPAWESTSAVANAEDRDELSPADAARRLLGFVRAAEDQAPSGERLLDEPMDIPDFFAQLLAGGRMDPSDLAKTIHDATDDELELAREDAHAFAGDFVENARATVRAYGDDFAGFGFFAVHRKEKEERFSRAACVLMLLTVRRVLGGDGIDQIKLSLNETTSQARAYNSIIDAFPEYAPYYRHDQETMLASADPDFVEKMRGDVAAFISAHPEVEAGLRSSE